MPSSNADHNLKSNFDDVLGTNKPVPPANAAKSVSKPNFLFV
jgi:hypothetical protein